MSQSWQFEHPNHGWLECKPCDATSFLLDPDLKDKFKIRLGEPMSEEFRNIQIEFILDSINQIRKNYPGSQHSLMHHFLDRIQRNVASVALKMEELSKLEVNNNGLAEE